MKWDHPRLLGWALNPMTSILIRDTQRGRPHEDEAKLGVVLPQAKELLEPPKQEETRKDSPP